MSGRTRAYGTVVFAGTFDRLHEGHKHLLRAALRLGDAVLIGLTTDMMLKKKESKSKIQSYADREAALLKFLKAEGHSSRCRIFPIESTEGGADTMPEIDALIVSDEASVIENAIRINGLRLKNGLKRFQIVIVPRVLTEDNNPVSSSRERRGEKLDPSRFRY